MNRWKVKTVLHISSGDLWAGAEVMIFNLLKKLKDYPDLKIIVMSLNEGVLTEKLRSTGIEIHVIPETTHSFLSIFLKTFNLLKGRRLDIIHSHRYKENLLGLLLAKSIRVERLISTIHGLSEPLLYGENGKTLDSWKTKMDYFILKSYFTKVISVSQEIKKVLIQKNCFKEKKINVIYNGIEIPESIHSIIQSSNQSANAHFHIGTVGRLVPVKDFDLFLKIAAELKKKTENIRFSILGDGPLRGELIQKAIELGIGDSVEFLSPLTNPFPYYQSLDLYLNTSLHEGIPLSILEAMACRKPVVALNVGGIPEIISHGENGVLIDRHKQKEFVYLCIKLIKDKELRTAMGENAFKRVSSYFSDSKMSASYRELYQQ